MESKSRNKVVDLALMIESTISSILGVLLDISTEDSKTLSNKSSAISLKTKIDLLTDIRALDREEAKKFEYFLQIRNQFVHNAKAHTFETCMSFIDGLEKKLLKDYPQPSEISKEEQIEKAFERLFKDLLNSLHKLFNKIHEKGIKAGENQGANIIIDSMHEICSEIENGEYILNKIYDRAKQKLGQNKI